MKRFTQLVFVLVIGLACLSMPVLAEDADLKGALKKDKTGTNPINFTHDFRLYNEYQFLNVAGDGFNNITTLEYRHPLADGKWQLRARIRGVKIQADTNNDGSDNLDKSGLGDIDIRVLTVPYLDMPNKFAVAVGLEVFLPSASDDALGTEALSLGPQVFGVFFTPFGIPGTLIAPAYQHRFSIAVESGAENEHKGLFDLFILWSAKDKQTWALVNPQMVLDYEQDREFGFVEVEVGRMIGSGHSIYVRPSISIGRDRPTDASIEIGYKIIWLPCELGSPVAA